MSGWSPNPAGATTGNDSFLGSGLADTAFGLDGDDTLTGLALADLLDGGAGNDSLLGGTEDDTLDGGLGNDRVFGNDGLDSILGGDGNDVLFGGNDADTLLGGAGRDQASGDAGNDLILGGDGNDDLFGGSGDDTLGGGAGADFAFGDDGRDTLDGGAGNDTLSGDAQDDAVAGGLGRDSLLGGSGNDSLSGGVGRDTLRGEADRDTLAGEGGNDSLAAGTGDDTIDGGEAADTMLGETGNDSLLGGNGLDFISDSAFLNGSGGTASGADTLLGGSGSDTLTSVSGGDSIVGGADRDLAILFHRGLADPAFDVRPRDALTPTVLAGSATLVGVELFQITGSALNDTLQGLDDRDLFSGLGGADSLIGRGGNDTLIDATSAALAEADTLDGGSGDDTLVSLSGADSILGGAGADTLSFGGSGVTQAIAFNPIDAETPATLGNGGTVVGIEAFIFNGTVGNDSVAGLGAVDALGGGGGDDTLLGRGGNDSLDGGSGDDSLDAGDGDDRLAGGAGNDTLLGGAGNDQVFLAGADNDLVDLGEGNDLIEDERTTADGRDTLIGGAGDDTIINPSGANSVVGGEGIDLFSSFGGSVPVAGALDFRPIDSDTAATLGGSTLVGFERFSLSGTVNADTLAGLGLDDVLGGGSGAAGDSLIGLGGNDTLRASNTAGTLEGGAGLDRIEITDSNLPFGAGRFDGGEGADTLAYSGTGSAQSLDFRPTSAAVPASFGGSAIVTGVEVFLINAGTGNDTVFGLDGDDSLRSQSGADWLAGGGGNDTINGGLPNTALTTGRVDTLQGGTGNDLIIVDSQAQDQASIDGGDGIDQLNLDGNQVTPDAPFNLDLVATTTPAGTGTGSTIVNVERFNIGGTGGADTIWALDDNDTIVGEGGSDCLRGGGGNDQITGGLDANTIDAGAGDDSIIGLVTGDVIDGGDGQDTLFISTNVALDLDLTGPTPVFLGNAFTITGVEQFSFTSGIGGDTVRGSAVAETLIGRGGEDSLFGNGGDDRLEADGIELNQLTNDPDTLDGGIGADTLESRAGGDSLVGGDGDDLAIIQRSIATVPIIFLPTDSATPTTLGDGSTVVGFERFEVTGSPGNDTLAGLDGDDLLLAGTDNAFNGDNGRGGDHSLLGRGGHDTLLDGEGNDTLLGGADNDQLVVTTGNDSIDGGEGSDTLSLRSGDPLFLDWVNGADLTLDGQIIRGTQLGAVRGIEFLSATSDDDRLTGLATGSETLLGEGGDDTLVATGGADSLVGGESIDRIYRFFSFTLPTPLIADVDVVSAGADTSSVIIDLAAQTVTGGALEGDRIAGFEGAEGGGGNDSLLGSAGNNRLWGQGGNDTLAGGTGNDTVMAGAGNDLVRWAAGDGEDTLDGGEGIDTLLLTGASVATEVGPEDFTRYILTPDAGGPATTLLARNFETVICFYPGTLIATPDGPRAVESLAIGDSVLTSAGIAAPVRWMGRQTVSTRFADPLRVLPIRIRAGALADGIPARDLLVSPDHALLVGGILIQAGALLGGTSITRERAVPEVFTYHHVELATHDLILAEGVAAETFVDNVERAAFDNWAEHEALYGHLPSIPEMTLPRAKAHRQVPARVRARLAARAGLRRLG